jgi:hypothetical protein
MKILPIIDPRVRFVRLLNRNTFSNSSNENKSKTEDKYATFFEILKFIDSSIFLIESILAISAFVYHETLYTEDFYHYYFCIATITFTSTVFIIVLKILRHRLVNKKKELMQFIYPRTIFGNRKNFFFFCEIFFYCAIPNPIFDIESIRTVTSYSDKFKVDLEYYVNDFLIVLVILKFALYAIPRCLTFGSVNNKKYRRIAYIYGIEDSLHYLFKYYFNNHTVFISLFLYIVGIIIFATCIKILERPNPEFDFTDIWNTLYFMYITFASVGYGDIYPISFLGKILTIISFVLGFLSTSLLTYSLMNTLNFESNQLKAYNMFEKSIVEKSLQIEIFHFFFYLRRLTNISVSVQGYRTRWLSQHYLQKFYASYRKLKAYKLEFKTLEGVIQNNQGEATKQKLDLYFNIFYKEIEKANKYQNEIAKITRKWVKPDPVNELESFVES